MSLVTYDAYNHQSVAPGTTYATGATGTTVAGTVVPVAAGAGTGSSTALITGATPNDTRGQFNLVTAGSPAAGAVAAVNFSAPYSKLPGSVIVTIYNVTDSTVVAASASSVTAAGFNISTVALTTAKTYQINYQVEA